MILTKHIVRVNLIVHILLIYRAEPLTSFGTGMDVDHSAEVAHW